jgi:fimbrial chaperone protein
MLLISSTLRRCMAILLCLFSWAQTSDGLASSFEVSPIRVTFSPSESTALMTVRNDGDQRLRLQVSVMAWNQNKQGEMVLDPTDDIIFYPNLLTLEPGAQRNLRVGVNGAVVAREKSYRIFVEELPSNVKLQFTGVRIVTKVSIPIFIRPAKAEHKNTIERIGLRGSDVTFELKNQGNVHIQPRELRVRGVAADGSLQLERKIPGWYILAGGLREYRIDVSKTECMKIRELIVEVDLEDKPFKETWVVPSGACAR